MRLALWDSVEARSDRPAENARRLEALRDRVAGLESKVVRSEEARAALMAAELRADTLQWKVDSLETENRGLREGRWQTEEYLQRTIRSQSVEIK